MKEVIKSASDFKIIPGNFKSACSFEILNVNDETITANLMIEDGKELEDYVVGSSVEVFGVNQVGLIYFETKILERNDRQVTLVLTNDYSLIQRREYSRVALNQGKVIFEDMAPNFILKVDDISAGGVKFISRDPLEQNKHYEIEIILSNNMKIKCTLQPIRIKETKYEDKNAYSISGKFLNLENADRIVLVQYAFKIKMEEQNKEND